MRLEILTLINALSGAIIGSLSSLVVTWLSKRYEERRYRRDLVFRTAIENWWRTADIAQRPGASRVLVPPLDVFIIHMVLLSDQLEKLNLIEELLAGKELQYPRFAPQATFKRAPAAVPPTTSSCCSKLPKPPLSNE
jgi:hypothetical protein